ncbi:MAG: YhjD/YihY/BrkB family envelope integrity protein, partial [Polyangiaceae bacterium]
MAVLRALREHDAFSAAGAMAFQFFLSMIPLLVLAGFVVGRLVRLRGVAPVMDPVLDLLPQAAGDLVKRELEGMAGAGAAPVAPLSVIGFLLVASNGTHAMMNVFERAFHAHRRPWWKKRLIASVWLVSVVVTIAVAVWGLSRLDRIVHRMGSTASTSSATSTSSPASAATREAHLTTRASASSSHHAVPTPSAASSAGIVTHETEPPRATRSHRARHGIGEKLVAFIVLLAIAFVALGSLYRFAIEHPKGIERRVWPGAAVAIAFWFPVSYAFGVYVSSLG